MKLPLIDNRPGEWPQGVMQSWGRLLARAQQLEGKAGGSDAFAQMLATLREMVRTGRFDGFKALLGRRLAARALTWLWLHDEAVGPRLLNAQLLNTLIDAQQPRLTRITLVQLIQLYLRFFDQLDERDKTTEHSLRALVEGHVLAQLHLLPEPRTPSLRPDALTQLKQHGHWLLGLNGPLALARHVREQGSELGATFEAYGLAGLDTGRYGDICRAHFYLETLRGLAPGEWDDVLDELLKPSVSKAPYEGDKRIGHAALEILIDRAGEAPGDAWQNFILNLAGDPRIASSSPNYRQWWLPLGEARINQVRGWLSKEDLRLFLQAVEQYGNESGKEDLQRMFPARKTFLEGLFKLGLIRHTRLMLGGIAQQSVRRIFGAEVKTNFARMEGTMNDKAAIYLDCGDFHLVEGSHSFKIWVYLAQPGPAMKSYERNSFSHSDLTIELPKAYKKLYPGLGYEAVTHNGTWQRKVFDFLAENGIGVDIEQLLSKSEYRGYLSRYGMPAVRGNKVKVPAAQQSPIPASGARVVPPASLSQPQPRSPASAAVSQSFGDSVARLMGEPKARATSVVNSIRAQNKAIADSGDSARGSGSAETSDASIAFTSSTDDLPALKATNPLSGVSGFLPDAAWKLLEYLHDHPLSQMGETSKALGISLAEANQLRSKFLKGLCQQETTQFGWTGWKINAAGEEVLRGPEEPSSLLSSSDSVAEDQVGATIASDKLNDSALAGRIARLPKSAIEVLRYFASNPSDKARFASNVLDIEIREINRLLHGPLSTFCKQDASFGWTVSNEVVAILNKLFP
jgi:hypothetical protein